MRYCNYVVLFSNGRVKVGMTSDPWKRKAYYLQEGNCHGLTVVRWEEAHDFDNKSDALLVERTICREFAEFALPHSREWFLDHTPECSQMFLLLWCAMLNEVANRQAWVDNRNLHCEFGVAA